jgi:hypothetical protein
MSWSSEMIAKLAEREREKERERERERNQIRKIINERGAITTGIIRIQRNHYG